MSHADNLVEFPTQVEDIPPEEQVSPFTYHYSAFRVNKAGETKWFDGIASLDAPILTMQQYGDFKKLIAEHYDIPNNNIVIVCLTRQNTMNFEFPVAQANYATG